MTNKKQTAKEWFEQKITISRGDFAAKIEKAIAEEREKCNRETVLKIAHCSAESIDYLEKEQKRCEEKGRRETLAEQSSAVREAELRVAKAIFEELEERFSVLKKDHSAYWKQPLDSGWEITKARYLPKEKEAKP